jgi:PAS domain S-box-containing protein
MQSNLYEFQKRQIVLIVRVTPYAMVGHLANTAVIAVALAGSVQPVPLIIWCAYSCSTALLLLFRHVKNRGRLPRSFQRAAKKVAIYAVLLALPWSSLAILYLGSLAESQELILVALGIGMAACATVLLSAIPRAAFIYMSVILIPTAAKCLVVSQASYLLLGTLALSYWGCLAALIAKTSRDVRERQEAEVTLAERDIHLALAAKAGLVGSYSYDLDTDRVQISEGYAAIHGLPEGTKESTRSAWQSRVLPEDRERINSFRRQAFSERRREYGAEYRIVRAGEIRWIESRGFISYSSDSHPQRVIGVNIDITERKSTEERQSALVAELDHRVKNALATVSSVVSHTGVGNRSVADFVVALEGRLRSMAATHELLGARWWQGVSLTELVRRELAPYAVRNNTEVSGPEVVLRAEAGQAMAMVLHELATNAAKYGALSTKNGRVSVQWGRRLNGQSPRLVLEWREIGGPSVIAPGNPSYGTSTIRDLIPYEFGGTVDLVFAPEGVQCRLELPADWLSGAADPVSGSSRAPSEPGTPRACP